MSRDLIIVVHDRPPDGAVAEFLSKHRRYALDGDTVERSARGRKEAAFIVDSPCRVELEDLPEALAATVLDPRFQIEINVPFTATRADQRLARRLAKHLAERFRGAAYDPQLDEIISRKRARVPRISRREERIRVIDLHWYVGSREPDPELPRRLLDVLRAKCPEALPRRYDVLEPFQHSFDRTGEEGFIEWWRDVTDTERGSLLFWQARSPCFSGSASFPDQRDTLPDGRAVRAASARRCANIRLSFDGRVLHADPRWAATVVELFKAIADRLDAFYAAAHVTRNVIAGRDLGYDGKVESIPTPTCYFQGLPPAPMWLSWFGREYASAVKGSLVDRAECLPNGSLFFAGGPEPMDRDELERVFPPLPAQLQFRVVPNPRSQFGGEMTVPAAWLPPDRG